MSKEITGFKPGSRSWKKFMAKVYGWGGAIVIIGAMFKIQHWPGAAIMLIGGLGIEAIIFILSAFEPLHEEVDWTLVYPELAIPDEDEEHLLEEGSEAEEFDGHTAIPETATITEQLDAMLEDAKIEPELIRSLGTGLRSLSDQASQLTDMSDAAVATNDYVSSVRNASQQVDGLTDAYSKASESLTSLAGASEDGAQYSDELKKMSSNLSSLNSVYEMQLKGNQEHLESSGNFYQGISKLVENLNDSIEHTQSYKTNIAELSKNLETLNTVYGNMLNAMNPGRSND